MSSDSAQLTMTQATRSRQAPNSLEAERSVLGGILLTNNAVDDILEIVEQEHFYRVHHQHIFGAMHGLHLRGEPIDIVTLAEELKRRGQLDDVGGVPYLESLDSAVPSTANLSRYAQIVADKWLLRTVIQECHSLAREGYEQKGDPKEFVDLVEQRIFTVTDRRDSGTFKRSRDVVGNTFKRIEQLYERQTDITGIPTGFEHLDRMTTGFQRGDLIIVAGRPSMGKTSVVMNMAAHVAIQRKLPVAVFSLEMSSDALMTRLLSAEARVDGQRLRTGKLLDSDWPKLARAADQLFHAPMFIDDTPGIGVMQMRAKCRRLKAKVGELGFIVVDYLQLMGGSGDADNREQEISATSRGLKWLAKELDVPVVALSQLNRSLERREDKRPMMSDLRESGAIEQDADVIAFVYRDEVYNKESPDKGTAEIIIGKQRNGPIGTVRVAFLKDYTRFETLADFQGGDS